MVAYHEYQHELSPPRHPTRRRPAARVASAAPHEPARLRGRSRDFLEAPELSRNRPLAAEPRDGAAPRRVARRAAARAQFAADRGRLRADVQRARADRSGAAAGTRSSRARAERSPTVSSRLRGSSLAIGCGERRCEFLHGGRSAGAAGGAAQRAARDLASRRHGATHRESRRMARACAGALASTDRGVRRRRARRSVEGAQRISRACRVCSHCRTCNDGCALRGAVPARHRRRRAQLHQHDHGFRHSGRRNSVRIGARVFLPGGCGDRSSLAKSRSTMSCLYSVDRDTAIPSEYTAGPWDDRLQHGGAPTALIAWAAERLVPREPMQVIRITVDLLRPVPIAPLQIRAEVVREGRKIQLCAVTLLHENVVVVRASVLKIRRAQFDLPPTAIEEKVELPGPEHGRVAEPAPGTRPNAFIRGLTLSVVKGAFREPGPAAIWFRAERPLLASEPLTPLQRTAMVADFCNGVSTVLDWNTWTFINADLTISLARLPVGDWILLDAQTWLGDHGSGIAFAKLGDTRGYFGRAVQSLVIEQR